MALTKISGEVIQEALNVRVVTATQVNVGSAVTIHSAGFSVGGSDLHSTGLNLGSGNIISHNINLTGIITATQFATGTSGSAIGINTNTISGPATITIDPAAIGDNTGLVVIKGDLQIDGTTTTINSTTLTVDDKNIVLGSGAVNDAAADGSGITIESGNGNKTFQFEDTGDNLGSSENLNVASGKVYKVNNTSVLSSTTLGSGVVNSSLTSVGTLINLNVGNVNSSGIVTATSFYGNGSALTNIAANQVLTQSNTTNADYFITFVDSNNGSATSETIYTDADISYNPSTNLLKVSGAVRIGAANLSSGGDYAHLATYEYYNGSSWVYSSATAGGLYQITGQAHNWSKHNGAGTHTTLLTLDASGNLVATANVTAYSDIKLKENINTIENALDKTLKLRGVTFTRKDIPEEGTQIGVIAQEVEEIIPEAVKLNIIETPEGTVDEIKTVAYGNLVGLLIEAIKEQQKTVKKLEKRIEDLEIVIT